ncbi:phosphoadenosine phosphosulfate reductase family protein [Streptomyces sp. LHD-70]|uniref:phosphoadenosine phosphosulfate reductase family protein n=1 Tax=Streptomyces sp. LHD-70 TaxID=3072140 RepID=UPI00280F8C5A|nr:phosphoadenosine phosphosulfate reductase family protein [Streptomyces sp. LHD-70]MDQ8707841.1 phosphoadenosine phosphosulfate reductase family protein [Streptomyces sp. LHD-70]
MKVVSYGGGVQSTALLVLAAQERISYRTFLFANVGDDSEHPATLRYVHEVAKPYAAAHGLRLEVLERRRRDGRTETLRQQLLRPESRSIPIPVRMSNGAPGRRSCTANFKIKVIGRWLREHGATSTHPATVAIGISVDELHRANRRRSEPHESIEYPLLDLGLRRTDCVQMIEDTGLPVPPKSACYFCPFKTIKAWQELRRNEPDLFAQAADLEAALIERRLSLGKDPAYLTRRGVPLGQAIPETAAPLPLADDRDADCDSGWCMT